MLVLLCFGWECDGKVEWHVEGGMVINIPKAVWRAHKKVEYDQAREWHQQSSCAEPLSIYLHSFIEGFTKLVGLPTLARGWKP